MQEFVEEPIIENLGVPDIEIGELKIWIHSRKYPDCNNFWDVNWLNSTFYLKSSNSSVWVSGDILHNTEIAEWLAEIEKLDKGLIVETNLSTMESYVELRIAPQSYERISIGVTFFPNDRFETHHFEIWQMKKILKDLTEGFQNILHKFPVKFKE
jgi:phage pi2 protein 07